jgi:biotin synthase
MHNLIDQLQAHGHLSADGYRQLLTTGDAAAVALLHERARAVSQATWGRGIFVRGLIELSNVCRNDCYYCGIRRSNHDVARYTLSADEVLQCCHQGEAAGFRTFVLQGGEWDESRDQWIADLVTAIRQRWPHCAITLSLGERRTLDSYALWRECGANRYLLRHETHNASHYATLHPADMSRDHRLQCLAWLKELDYQTGTGMMIGSPGQTIDHLVEDIEYIAEVRPEMIGLGPFIPHPDTPLCHHRAGSVDLTLRLYSIFRLMFPQALIQSTTALATLTPSGRLDGILAGANVVMPNLSPTQRREQYAIYAGKASSGAEAAEGIAALERQLATIGYHIDWGRGDHKEFR